MLSTELTELLKQHYLTGCYAYMYMRVSGNGWEVLKILAPKSGTLSVLPFHVSPVPLPPIFGIPVYTDDSLPPNVWELRNTETDEILRTGLLESTQ